MSTEKIVTPIGDLEWVFIDGEGKEDLNGTHKYSVDWVADEETAKPLIEKIKAFWEANKPAGFKKAPKSLGFYPHTVKEGEEYVETGKIKLVFKTNTTFKDGKPKVIDVYNAKAQKIHLGGKKIGNGSQGAVSSVMGIYEIRNKPSAPITGAGVTLYLNAIQLTKFVEFTGSDAGFAAMDDGFTGEDEETGFEQQEEAPAKPRL